MFIPATAYHSEKSYGAPQWPPRLEEPGSGEWKTTFTFTFIDGKGFNDKDLLQKDDINY